MEHMHGIPASVDRWRDEGGHDQQQDYYQSDGPETRQEHICGHCRSENAAADGDLQTVHLSICVMQMS